VIGKSNFQHGSCGVMNVKIGSAANKSPFLEPCSSSFRCRVVVGLVFSGTLVQQDIGPCDSN